MLNTESPLVSVLMTVYNRQDFVSEAIESVLNSTFVNFELIIVDDCSTDNSLILLRKYEERDSRIRVYLNEKNLGDYPNRNRAASYARGKYIKYLDADDLIYPWALDVVVSFMECHSEADYGLDSIEPDLKVPFPILLNPYEAYYRNYFIAPVFHKAPSSCIIKRAIFESNGGFPTNRLVGDFEFWNKLSRRHNVLLMPQGMIWSRMHSGQESYVTRNSSVAVFKYLNAEYLSLKHPECPFTNLLKEKMLRRVERYQARSILRSLLIERNMNYVSEKVNLSGIGLFKAFIISCRKYA